MNETTRIADLPGQWNLTDLYTGDNDPRIHHDIHVIEVTITAFAAKYVRLTARSAIGRLAEALADFERLQRLFLAEPTIDNQLGGSKPEYYLMLRDASARTPATQAAVQRLAEWRQTQLEKLEFFFRLFDGASAMRRRALLNSSELHEYRGWLAQRFMLSTVTTSTPATRTAASAAKTKASRLTNELDAAIANISAVVWKGDSQQDVALSGIVSLTTSSDDREWRSAAAVLPALLARLKDQAFVELTAALTAHVAEASLLGVSVEAARCAADALSPGILDNLISVIMSPEALDVAHKYYALKAVLMDGRLPFARRRAMYGSLKKYTWPQAVDLIRTFCARISPALVAEFDYALAGDYIDAEPRIGKTSQTACWWAYGQQPRFAVNFTGDLDNILQILHEFVGHYMAALAVSRQRNGLSYNTRIPLAETHGVSWQLLAPWVFADKLNLDDWSNLDFMMAQLETLMTTVYLQGVATAFEQRLYVELQQNTLSLDQLESLFAQYMHKQFGDAVAIDDLTKVNWVIWSQLRQGLYNYGYVMAGMIAIVLRERYETDQAEVIRQINLLMEAGSKDVLAVIYEEVDITLDLELWQRGIQAIAAQLDKAIALARQLGLIPAA